MAGKHELDGFDMTPASLEREWVITVDTPSGGVEPVLEALGDELPLVQGPYDNCMYVRENGYQRFRALEGSHAGAEGSVQQTDDRVRITVQLIEASTGHHDWAHTYDRQLKDIFALQDEITMKVMTELRVKLTEGEAARIYAKSSNNLDAYLKGRKAVVRLLVVGGRGDRSLLTPLERERDDDVAIRRRDPVREHDGPTVRHPRDPRSAARLRARKLSSRTTKGGSRPDLVAASRLDVPHEGDLRAVG